MTDFRAEVRRQIELEDEARALGVGRYTKELGEFLARHYDANVIRSIILSARSGALFTGDTGGTGLQNAAFATDASALIDGMSMGRQAMDEKDVPLTSQALFALLKPAQWYMLARSEKNLNKNYNGDTASVRSMSFTTIDDTTVLKSNLAPFGDNDSANTAIPAPYRAKFGTTVGTMWTPYAAASAIVQDVGFTIVDQPEKQGTLLIARMMVGTRKLRSKCAVELRTGAIPA